MWPSARKVIDLRTPNPTSTPARHQAQAPQPSAGRFGPSRWRSGRLALGILLVLVAVLGGALLLRKADTSDLVLAAERDLASGVPLQRGDVRAVRVRLPAEQLRAYVRPGQDVTGGRLAAGLAKGALIPASLLVRAGQPDMVEYPVPVEAVDVPDLRPGDRVAVAVSYDNGERRGQGVVLLASVEVVRVLRDTGGIGADERIRAVQIRLPKERLAAVAGAIAGGRISMARLAPGDLVGIPATRQPPATTTPAARRTPAPDQGGQG